ncbi:MULTISPECIES: NAD(P)/FAD-dependent oxidoreductase [Paraburkholderia]|uniref:FAD/NAD(P)-dependent oxidoreductase n=1 Tax=Paraburkholderia TaxID=1822464 RepID=UPI00224DCEFC|nr:MULTISPECIES: NAD(P)/FAD-dependent oxidoreductase [Paraburkholderia]MCX4163866.1 NAD(P)/FAD-dependent oxidoreductase [Paraburkholderia megapolitana]MDN7159361.1 FAD-dependent oxidoreductase [Paraburkholderia sp. CHISQ3]MDQ6496408.1 FAD-dependent oxidoreductase [Paraburkholderia megapolitana]
MAARVIVIGSGPAGVRAAEALVEAGLRPTLIDEGRRDGGQIYRRQPEGFSRTYETLYGTEASKAAALHRRFDALREQIDYLPETLVWNITPNTVHLATDGAHYRSLAFDALIVCSGATDRLMPVKGWQAAGTYSLGGAQVALKSQGCAIGTRTVMMGTGPLLYLVAAQYVKAGANVAAVLDTSTFAQRLAALPQLLAMPAALLKGIALLRVLKRARVPVHRGVSPLEIVGTPQHGVSGVAVALQGGARHELACDAVALGYHLRPETQLADLAGCEFQFDAPSRQWLPGVDEDGRSSVKGVYLAGDGARVRGADAAERSGRLAALAALHDCGMRADGVEALRAELARFTRFAAGLRTAFPWPHRLAASIPDDAVVCRCEAITAGELRRVVREGGAREANRAKAFSRVGMGRCQGRYCGHAGAEIIALAASIPLSAVGRLRGQAPVKPLPVALDVLDALDALTAPAVEASE